jgi:hypothetical protein
MIGMRLRGSWQNEPVQMPIRRRGHVIAATGDVRDLFVPTEALGNDRDEYYRYFGKLAFRKVARELLKAKGMPVPIERLEQIAPLRAEEYIQLLEKHGAVEWRTDGVVVTRLRNGRPLDNLGPRLEEYVAHLCKSELAGDAAWSVKLERAAYGDYDVLAWLPPLFIYIECKGFSPGEISDNELRYFLQRAEELRPDFSVLLVDVDSDLADFRERLQAVMVSAMRKFGDRPSDWQPEHPFFSVLPSYSDISYDQKIYITNAQPTILSQLRACLRHYHRFIHGRAVLGGPAVDWIRGRVVTGLE